MGPSNLKMIHFFTPNNKWLFYVFGISTWNSFHDDSWSHGLQLFLHDDVIKCKHFPRYWPFVRRIHRSTVNSPHKGQWRGALIFSFICVWINGWVNYREAGDLRLYRVHCDVIVMDMPIENPLYEWLRNSTGMRPFWYCLSNWFWTCCRRGPESVDTWAPSN